MTYIPKPTDNVVEGRGKLLTQYETDFLFFNNLMDTQLKKLNELDTALQDILTKTGIMTATGLTLDILGNIVDVYRDGLSDEPFRQIILTRLSSGASSGTPSEIMSAVKTFTSATSCKYWSYYPANFILETNGTKIAASLEESVKNISPVSVGYFAILSSRLDNVFRPAELSQLTGQFIDNNSKYITTYDGSETKKLDVIYSSTDYELSPLNTSILPDIVEVTDTGEVYLVDQLSGNFIDNIGNYIITGYNVGWKEIVLNSNSCRLSEVYQYATTN